MILGFAGLVLLIFSFWGINMTGSAIGVKISGTNIYSRIIGAIGIAMMIAALIIENYEAKQLNLLKKNSGE